MIFSFSSCIYIFNNKNDEFAKKLRSDYQAESVEITKITENILGEEQRYLEIELINASLLEDLEAISTEALNAELEQIRVKALEHEGYQQLISEVDEIRIELTNDLWLLEFSEVYAFPIALEHQ